MKFNNFSLDDIIILTILLPIVKAEKLNTIP